MKKMWSLEPTKHENETRCEAKRESSNVCRIAKEAKLRSNSWYHWLREVFENMKKGDSKHEPNENDENHGYEKEI